MLHHFKEQMNVEGSDQSDSVFSSVLELINHLIESLTSEICSNITLEISAKSRSYRRDRFVFAELTFMRICFTFECILRLMVFLTGGILCL